MQSFLAVLKKRLDERSSSQDLIACGQAMSVYISLASRAVESLHADLKAVCDAQASSSSMAKEGILSTAGNRAGVSYNHEECTLSGEMGKARNPSSRISLKVVLIIQGWSISDVEISASLESSRCVRRGAMKIKRNVLAVIEMAGQIFRFFEIAFQNSKKLLKSFLAVLKKRLDERSSSQDLIACGQAMSVKIALASRAVEVLPYRVEPRITLTVPVRTTRKRQPSW